MRVAIIGAGPAGLYLAILLAQADPRHEIRVVERNPADATYGWGVVFSADTLGGLRDADPATFRELDAALVRWDALDVRLRGRTWRAAGHGFSAIARQRLLSILQQRAAALGVTLAFEREAAPDDFPDADLVVAADGVNSETRTAREKHFGTRRDTHATRFAWFGADRAFDAFTFAFAETDHGLFTVHAYPFDEGHSTFIVEVSRETFARAGLDAMDEAASLAHCQRLFADELDGATLLSNRSRWIEFVTVRNRTWYDGNLALIGDAAHTAHFTIGSGTKLAMEDAVGLAAALAEHGDDVPAALAAFEADRQLPVERFQQAATDSAAYFARLGRYLDLAPEQFVFNLLTRSGRITHRSVSQRDPGLANHVDRRVAATDAPARRLVVPPPSQTPFDLGGLVLANRVVLAPPAPDTAVDGQPGAEHARRLVEAAGRGAGLVVTEPVAVSAHGRVTSGSAGLFTDAHAEAWTAIARGVHDAGGALALRLSHAGRRGSMRPRRAGLDRPLAAGGWTTLAPSPIPYDHGVPVPAALEQRTIAGVVADFAAAAGAAARAGVDVLLLDWSDGYLLGSCVSPLTNRRSDAYGGDLDGRLRLPLAVLDAVRQAWPQQRPLAVRLTVDDRVTGGLGPDDGVVIAGRLRAAGVALVDAVGGHTLPSGGVDYRRGFQVELADRVRNEAGVPAVASGAITTFDEVDTVVAAGRADLCLLDPARYLRPVVDITGRTTGPTQLEGVQQ